VAYPKAAVQLCIAHMVRNSLNFVSWKMRKAVAADLRLIYASATAAAGGVFNSVCEASRLWKHLTLAVA